MAAVLVVDDESVVVDVMEAALRDEGHEVITASHGQQAMDKLSQRPDAKLIISDFTMPVLDGGELVEALRDHAVHHATPCIIMSALPEERVQKRTNRHVAFIKKPFRLDDVVKLVAFVLAGGRLR